MYLEFLSMPHQIATLMQNRASMITRNCGCFFTNGIEGTLQLPGNNQRMDLKHLVYAFAQNCAGCQFAHSAWLPTLMHLLVGEVYVLPRMKIQAYWPLVFSPVLHIKLVHFQFCTTLPTNSWYTSMCCSALNVGTFYSPRGSQRTTGYRHSKRPWDEARQNRTITT